MADMKDPGNSLLDIEKRITFADLSFNDCLRLLREAQKQGMEGLRPLKVAVLRSFTVEMMEPVLRLRLMLEGFKAEFFFGDYNAYAQEILDSGSRLYAFTPDIVLLMVRMDELLPDFIHDFPVKETDAWEEALSNRAGYLASLADKLGERLKASVLIQNGAIAGLPYWGVYDAQIPGGQRYLIERYNGFLAEELGARTGAFVWDFDMFLRAHGRCRLLDPKNWYTSKSPFLQSIYPAMADDIARHIISLTRPVKKCIVVDLDNTLWGGIAGEDGMAGIGLGPDYPGNCYVDFQKGLLRLYNRGIVLAINSKNNEDDAMDIIRKHPAMVLEERHFAAMRINWCDKASNLRSIAKELNIGLESMIFIDDNPVECDFVRQSCPEVDVVQLPDKPYHIPAIIGKLPSVENIVLTAEDRKKGELYHARAARNECEMAFDDIEQFLDHLEMKVTIEEASEFSLPRIAQLTQKTNQMNLTTRRYSEADILGFARSEARNVFSVAVQDRFGDNGIVGVVIIEKDGAKASIDTFLLSCRVIGRNIEQAMMAHVADFLRGQGIRSLSALYIPTAKNKPAAGMYERLGLKKTGDNTFSADLSEVRFTLPSYITLSRGGSAAIR